MRAMRRVTRRQILMAAAVAAAAVLALAGCGAGAPAASDAPAGSSPGALGTGNLPGGNPNLDPGSSLGGEPAPGFRLTNQFGQAMSLSQFRGKVILLSFDDDQCTTICPLTTEEMLQAKDLLGAAGSHVQLLGVNANPDYTATSDVMAYSRVHGMVNQWDFLTGSKAQLTAVWKKYKIYSQVVQGLVDHTPALYIIGEHGRQQRIYLTSMAYASIGQQAELLAQEISRLLPGNPRLAKRVSLARISDITPRQTATLASARSAGRTVTLRAGTPHLAVFFATWVSEVSNLKGELTGLNAYARAVRTSHLPALTAVDEAVTEPGTDTVRGYLSHLGATLDYPVGMDTTGRVADGYGVQDQPWYVLTSASGKIVWHHDGWMPVTALEHAVKQHTAGGH